MIIFSIHNPSERSTESKLYDILYNVAMYLRSGSEEPIFIYPLRFSAVLLKQQEQWKFHSMHFSYPNKGYPIEHRPRDFIVLINVYLIL